MTVITVRPGQPGQCIQIPNPSNPSENITVYVPPHAKPGSKMAVPLPRKGESVQAVQEKQKAHEKSGGWSTGGKIAAAGAGLVAVGAVGVGGVILGDHLAGGDMAADIGAGVVDAGEAIGDVAVDAGEGIADFAGDAVDWLGDAGEDVGDFIMDLFCMLALQRQCTKLNRVFDVDLAESELQGNRKCTVESSSVVRSIWQSSICR